MPRQTRQAKRCACWRILIRLCQAAALDWLHEKVPALDEKQAEAVRALVAKRLTNAADPLISAVPCCREPASKDAVC